ncbi:MAG: chemotaxis protein CheC [Nanobdellota archaeon]
MTHPKITDIEKDALRETANVGSGNAAKLLSDLLEKKVNLKISNTDFVELKHVENQIAGPQNLVVGVYTPLKSNVSGNIVIMFNKDSAKCLASAITAAPDSEEVITEQDKKILKKIGTTLSGSYVESLNTFLDLDLIYDRTNIISTFGESIIDIIMLNVDPDASDALLIETEFVVDGTSIEGKFIILLAVKSVDVIIDAIRNKM